MKRNKRNSGSYQEKRNNNLENFLFFIFYKKRYVKPYRIRMKDTDIARGQRETSRALQLYKDWQDTVAIELIQRSVRIAFIIKKNMGSGC